MSGLRLHRPRNWVLLCLLLPALTGCMLGQSSAQPESDLGDASLEQLMNVEVYSASKHQQSVQEAPAFVTIVTAEEIRNYGYRTLADILRAVPGFYVTYNRNYSFLGTQGFSRPGDYNSRILLLLDGHRMNDVVYEYAMIGPELPLDVDLIERVEVIRGPASSLYGTSAFFGVVNIITRRGQGLGTEVSAEGASFGTGKGRVTYGNTLRGWEVLLSGSFYGSAGQNLYFPEFDTPETNNGIARGLDDESANDFLLKVSRGHFILQSVYGVRDKGVPTASFGTIFGDPRERTTDERGYLDGSYDLSFRGWNLHARAYLDHYRYHGTYPYSDGSSSVLNYDYALGQWWGSEAKLTRTIHDKHLITGGIEFRDNFHQDQRNYDLDPYQLVLHEDHSSTLWAFYLQDEFAITPKLSLDLGLRHDHYTTLDTTNPRLALILRPWERTTVKLVAGEAFRAPNAYETYNTLPVQKLNPDLHAERVRTAEAIVEQLLGRHWRLSASAHKDDINGLISPAVDPRDGETFLNNNDQMQGQGVQLQVARRLNNGIEGHASYSYEDEQTNKVLTNLPRDLAKLNLTVPLFRRRLSAGWETQYTSPLATLSGTYLGGFVVSNLTIMARNLGKHADLSFNLYNLFDKKYADPGGYEHVQNALQQDGRSFRVKLQYRF